MMDLTGFFVHQYDITYGTLNSLSYVRTTPLYNHVYTTLLLL